MSEPLLKVGAVIDDRFELVRRLGSGAIGVVWMAKDREASRDVALKILHSKLLHDMHAVGQLEREAVILDQLDHPNIARMHSFVSRAPTVYLAMEYVNGAPLHEVIGEHSKSREFFRHRDVRDLFAQLCGAVAYAHSRMIIHRDLKPHNVMIARRGDELASKVLDFGIAKILEKSMFDATTMGRQMGSLFYMSPEQTHGIPADARSDVFSLGTILFEMMTLHRAWARDDEGRPAPAFSGPVPAGEVNSIGTVFARIGSGDRPRPTSVRSTLPSEMDRLIAKALAAAPGDRFQTVDELMRSAMGLLDAMVGQNESETDLFDARAATPRQMVDEVETRLERPAATALLETSGGMFQDLTEAAPTDKKARMIPETVEYRAAEERRRPERVVPRIVAPLEEAAPTVRATGPLPVVQRVEVISPMGLMDPVDTRSMEGPIAEEVEDVEIPSSERRLPPTAEMADQNLRIPLLVGAFIFAAALAAVVTVTLRARMASPPIAVPVTIEPQPKAVDFSRVDRLLEQVKAKRDDDELRLALKDEIVAQAERIRDEDERRVVRTQAVASYHARTIEGFEGAVERLKIALENQ
jgi:serine/threonine-protein kinase